MTSSHDSDSVLIVAAEASSVLYARRLLEYWQNSGRKVHAFGIGNQEMVDMGFEALARSEDLAVVGFQEVLSHWPVIKKAFYKTLEEAEKRKPKFVLLLDYPGFNLRLAKKLKKMDIPVVYYISPQIWAWRKGRVKDIKKTIAKVLTLFPFENEFYVSHDVPVEFVGHPILDELDPKLFDVSERKKIRQRFGFDDGQVVLGLMPGSRKSEIHLHLETQLETARRLLKENPNSRAALLVAPGLSEETWRPYLENLQFPLTIVRDEPLKMIQMTDVVLCASGTATIMVGLMKKPMVIMYRMKGLTVLIAKRLVKRKQFFGMVNLIFGREVVPERFQDEASPEKLADLLHPYLTSEEKRKEKSEELSKLEELLGDRGATQRVAKALESFF